MSTLDNWLQTKSRKAAVPKPTTNIDFDEFDDVQLLEALNTAEDECPGFDVESGTRWIYPTNLPVRDYQLEITRTALFNNTLVALPTGLGKTLIAAVVIYNYQRWYPSRKILFMAPTKPLVAQQIDACCNIMCLPASDCCTMTGSSLPKHRTVMWHEKRIFFLTPQIVQNDLHRGICPAKDICLVVVDEAHRSQGRHAYVEVVRELHRTNKNIRILGLSATPGENMQSVQQVVDNLLISKVELRSEDSADVRRYAQDRCVEQIKITLTDDIEELKAMYTKLLTPIVQRLRTDGNLWISNIEKLSNLRNILIVAKKKFQAGRQFGQNDYAMKVVDKDYAMALSLAHSFEILQTHGIWCLYQTLLTAHAQHAPQTSVQGIRQIMARLDRHFSNRDNCPGQSSATAHPKIAALLQVVNDHFRQNGDSTRVIVFSQFRVSVEEIAATLRSSSPLVSVAEFVGQSNSGGSSDITMNQSKGLTQKEQQKVLDSFRSGRVNTLVATSVAEEGLDIGSVDLIVCFDVQQSSLRMVQRMGRTGRKRNGKVVVLLVPGVEDKLMAKAEDKQKKLSKEISTHANRLSYYPGCPRMVPSSITPEPLMMPMDKAQPSQPSRPSNTVTTSKSSTKGKKPPSSKKRASLHAPLLASPLFQYTVGDSSSSSSQSLCRVNSQTKSSTQRQLSFEEECSVIDCVHKFFQPAVFRSPQLRALQFKEDGRGVPTTCVASLIRDEDRILSSVHCIDHSERTVAYVELMNSCDELSSSLPIMREMLNQGPLNYDNYDEEVACVAVGCDTDCPVMDESELMNGMPQSPEDMFSESQSDLVPLPPTLSSLFDNLGESQVATLPEDHLQEDNTPPRVVVDTPTPGRVMDANWLSQDMALGTRPVWETPVTESPPSRLHGSPRPMTTSTPCQYDLTASAANTRVPSRLRCQRSWLPKLSVDDNHTSNSATSGFLSSTLSPDTREAAYELLDDCLASPVLPPPSPITQTTTATTAGTISSPIDSSSVGNPILDRHHEQCPLPQSKQLQSNSYSKEMSTTASPVAARSLLAEANAGSIVTPVHQGNDIQHQRSAQSFVTPVWDLGLDEDEDSPEGQAPAGVTVADICEDMSKYEAELDGDFLSISPPIRNEDASGIAAVLNPTPVSNKVNLTSSANNGFDMDFSLDDNLLQLLDTACDSSVLSGKVTSPTQKCSLPGREQYKTQVMKCSPKPAHASEASKQHVPTAGHSPGQLSRSSCSNNLTPQRKSSSCSPGGLSPLSDSSPVNVGGGHRRRAVQSWLSSQPAIVVQKFSKANGKRAMIDSESESSEDIGTASTTARTKCLVLNDTSDESMIVNKRCKTTAHVLADSSVELDNITSPLSRVTRKSGTSKRHHMQSDGTDSDFEAPSTNLLVKKKTIKPPSKHVSAVAGVAVKKKKFGSRLRVNDLVDCEADVDDDEVCSSDEELGNTYYDMNDSFIDDASQSASSQSAVVEKSKKPSSDMRAVYLQSLLSPMNNQFGGRRARNHGGVKLRVSHRHQFLRQALGYGGSVTSSVSTDEDDEAEEDNAVHDMMSSEFGSDMSAGEDEEDGEGETLGEEDTSMEMDSKDMEESCADLLTSMIDDDDDNGDDVQDPQLPDMPARNCAQAQAVSSSRKVYADEKGTSKLPLSMQTPACRGPSSLPDSSCKESRSKFQFCAKKLGPNSSNSVNVVPHSTSVPKSEKASVSIAGSKGNFTLPPAVATTAPCLSADSGVIKFPKPSSNPKSQPATSSIKPLASRVRAPVSKPSKACDGGSKPSKACDGGGSAAAATGGTGNWLDAFSLEYIDELATTSDLSSQTSGLCRPPGSKSRDRLQVKSQMSLTKPKSLLEPSGKSYQSTPTTVPLNTQSPCAAEVTARKTSTTITHYDQAGENQPHPPSKQLGSLPATSHGKSVTTASAKERLHILVGSNYPPYQQILSDLRHRHSNTVLCHFCHLQHTGVVVSQRMVVECISSSDLSSIQRRRQISQRIQQHRIHYARVAVLVQSVNGTDLLTSGCEDFLMDIVAASRVLLLWSCNQDKTASLIVDLAQREAADHGAAITASPVKFGSEKMVEMLCNINAITLSTAMHIRQEFGNIAELCIASSSPVCLRRRLSFISQRQAKNITYFFAVQFDPAMLPKS